MTTRKKTQIGFALEDIKTEQFAILEENYHHEKETKLGTELQFKLDKINRLFGVFVEFEFIQGKKVFIKIQVSCHFKIEESSWESLIQKEDNRLVIPKGFVSYLTMITIGTARGILFAKTEGSMFSRFIIPTSNTEDMIKEDISFDMIDE